MTYRKIIQLSPTTKVVSLPSDWLKRNSIKKGDSVSLKQEDNKIIIEAETSTDKACFIDVSKLNEDLLWMIVDTVYMLGYSNVRLKVTKEQMRIMIKLVKYFPVFIIGTESKEYIELKAVSKSLDMDLEKTVQRIRQLTNMLIDEGLNGAPGKDVKKIDYSINTYVSVSFRILSTSSMGASALVAWSQLVKILELMADRICIMFDETQSNFKMTPKDKKMIIKFRELYNLSFELIHKFSNEKANIIDNKRMELEEYSDNSSFALHIKELAQSTHDLEEVIFQICMKDLK